jgi:predicted ester cyclase
MDLQAKNKAAYKRFYEEFLNKGKLAVVDEVVDRNVVSHAALPGQKPGAEGLKEAITLFRQAFPDLTAKAEDIIAEGDKVVGRFTVKGTHKGKFMDFEPTGNPFTYAEVVIVRFKDGKIVEHWAVTDVLSMMQQIGAIPS